MYIYVATHRRSLVVCALFSVSMLASTAIAQETLRWKFTKGDQLRFHRKQERILLGTVGDQPLSQSTDRETDVTLVVDAVEEDGTARITQTIDRVRFNQKSAGGDVEYDSASASTEDGGKLAASLQPLVGLDFSFRMSPRGEVSKVELSEASKKRLADNPTALPAGLETELLRQLVPTMLLPEQESVSAGTTWQEVTELVEPRVGTRKVTSIYEYTGSHQAGENWMADVKIRGSATLEPAKDAAAKIEVLNESIAGTAHFDPRSGYLVERSEKDSTRTRIEVQGQSFEQDVENLVTIKRVLAGTSSAGQELHP